MKIARTNLVHCQIKVRVTVGLKNFPYIQQYKVSALINSVLVQARTLIMIYKIDEYRHARVILRISRECIKLLVFTPYLRSGSC